MKVITLKMPWCFFVELGWKTIETRTHKNFANLNGQRIAIHAGKSWDNNWEKDTEGLLDYWQIEQTKDMRHDGGKIICTVYVDDFRELNYDDSQGALCDCGNVKRYGLFLSDVKFVMPQIHVNGQLGAWEYNIK